MLLPQNLLAKRLTAGAVLAFLAYWAFDANATIRTQQAKIDQLQQSQRMLWQYGGWAENAIHRTRADDGLLPLDRPQFDPDKDTRKR